MITWQPEITDLSNTTLYNIQRYRILGSDWSKGFAFCISSLDRSPAQLQFNINMHLLIRHRLYSLAHRHGQQMLRIIRVLLNKEKDVLNVRTSTSVGCEELDRIGVTVLRHMTLALINTRVRRVSLPSSFLI